jgi:hypothetical protein
MQDISLPNSRLIQRRGSKGQQFKYFYNGLWYKVAQSPNGAVAEVAASRLLQLSNLRGVLYRLCRVNGRLATVSADFSKGCDLLTFDFLYLTHCGKQLEEQVGGASFSEKLAYAKYVLGEIRRITSLSRIADYVSLLTQFDAITLNTDRHFGNIAVLRSASGEYHYCPAFDFDSCFFAYGGDLKLSAKVTMSSCPAMPFASTHGEQLRLLRLLSDAKLTIRPIKSIPMLLRGIWTHPQLEHKNSVTRYLREVLSGG